MTYDSGREAFLSDSTLYYLFAKQTSGSASAWFHATYSGGENCPLCKITSTAGNVIKNGTWNANGSVTYSGTTYWIVLYRASNGTLYAEATPA